MVLTSPAPLLKEGVEAGIDKWARRSGASALDSADKTSFRVLFKSGLFQFTGWESYISGPSALWCHVSLLKFFTSWAVERWQEFARKVYMLPVCGKMGLSWIGGATQPSSCCCWFFPSTNPSHEVLKATKTVVINASVELTLDEYHPSCSSDLHSIPLVQWTFRVLPGSRTPTHAGVWNELRAVFRRANCHQKMWRAIFPPDGFEPATWNRELQLHTIFCPPPLTLIPLWIHCPRLILFASAAFAACEWSV